MTVEALLDGLPPRRWTPHRPIYLMGDRVRLLHGGPRMVVCDFNEIRARCAFRLAGIDRLHWITRDWLVPAMGPWSINDELEFNRLQAFGMSRHAPTTVIN